MPTTRWGGVCLFTLMGGLFVGVGCDPGEPSSEAPEDAVVERAALPLVEPVVTFVAAALAPPLIDALQDVQYQRGPERSISHVVRGGKPKASDFGASYRVLHDANALYLFVDVRDERVVRDSERTIPWEDDAVEIFLDGDMFPAPRYDGVDDVHLIFRPGDPEVHLGVRSAPVRPSSIRFQSRRTDGGYQLEVAIPWWAVGTTWREDSRVGLDVHVDDDDDGGTRDHKLTWTSIDDEAWRRPDRFGRIHLDADILLGYFAGVGDLPGGKRASYVNGISASGDVVVGHSQGASGEEAFRFTLRHGLVGLGRAPSRATAVSPNGALVVGPARDNDGETTGALWRGSSVEFMFGEVEYPPFPPTFRMYEPGAVFDDGRVHGACLQWAAYGTWLGCRWDGPGKIAHLRPFREIWAADTQGNVGGAYTAVDEWDDVDAVAVLNGVRLPYPWAANCLTPDFCRSRVRAFSAGAQVVVGTSNVSAPYDYSSYPNLPDTAFVYTAVESTQRLPDLAGGYVQSGAYSVSANGRIIGGYGANAQGKQAVLWLGRQAHLLRDRAKAREVVVPAGWRLLDVRAMSADGRTFAGNAINPHGDPEGFVLFLVLGP